MDNMDDLLTKIAERAQKKKTKGIAAQIPLSRLQQERLFESSESSSSNTPRGTIAAIQNIVPDTVADIVFLVALPKPELSQILEAFDCSWAKEGREGIIFNVGRIKVADEEIVITAATQTTMGMVSAAILATKAIRAWRPKIVCMAGICAGIRGKST